MQYTDLISTLIEKYMLRHQGHWNTGYTLDNIKESLLNLLDVMVSTRDTD